MKKALLGAVVALGLAATGWVLLGRSRESSGHFLLDVRAPSQGRGFSSALEQTVGAPLRPGHKLKLLPNGKVFDELTSAIREARQSVNIEMYIWSHGRASTSVISALRERRKGVACRVLLDAEGSISRGDEVDKDLRDVECSMLLFRKATAIFARNHRKVAVIDGRIGITGGFGVDDKWLGDAQDEDHWRDTNVRVEGTAVSDMQEAFAEDWQEAGGGLLPPDDFPDQPKVGTVSAAFVRSTASPVVTRAERLTQLAIDSAHQRFFIENAYFVPGKPVLELLGRRAKEGVDVRLLVPGRQSDSKLSFLYQQREYRNLLKSGTRVWEFQPTMMHAKTMVVDSSLVVIGSVNLDPLSLNKLEEAALVAEDPALASELAKLFEDDVARSKEQH
ncbi:MAG TPA: phospholipase D-like domain-containing protein [Myxococcales bacterium]|nr:phospholipase D-like domain-containing protein [Myxococcales bacterium]